jgi:hypothetical protein
MLLLLWVKRLAFRLKSRVSVTLEMLQLQTLRASTPVSYRFMSCLGRKAKKIKRSGKRVASREQPATFSGTSTSAEQKN